MNRVPVFYVLAHACPHSNKKLGETRAYLSITALSTTQKKFIHQFTEAQVNQSEYNTGTDSNQ